MEIDHLIDDRPVAQRTNAPVISSPSLSPVVSPVSMHPIGLFGAGTISIQKPTGPIGYVQHTTPVQQAVQTPVKSIVDTAGQPVPDTGSGGIAGPSNPVYQQIVAQPTQSIPTINPSPDNVIQQFLSGFKGLFQPSSASQQQPQYASGGSGGGISINVPATQSGAASVADIAPQLISANPKLYGLIAVAVIIVVLYFIFKK